MSNREKRVLSRRLLLCIAIPCFGFWYSIGCAKKHGNSNADASSIANAGSSPIATGQDRSADSKPIEVASTDSGLVAAEKDGDLGSSATSGAEGMTAGTDGVGTDGAGTDGAGIGDTGGENIVGIPPVTSAVPGDHYVCLHKKDGSVSCWGDTESSGNERLRLRVNPGGSYTQVNGSGALKNDGTITCWEWESDDAGVVNPDSFSLISTDPGSYTQVTNADGLGCAIKSDGELSCWGNDEYKYFLWAVPSGSFTQVSVSTNSQGDLYNACAVRTDESIACWNEEGETEVPLGSFSQVFVGKGQNCAIRSDNSIVCWGGTSSLFLPATL